MTTREGMRTPAIVGRRPILVTGGAGFIGSNVADRLARDGNDVLVYDVLARPGVEANLAWLKKRHPQRVSAILGDAPEDVRRRQRFCERMVRGAADGCRFFRHAGDRDLGGIGTNAAHLNPL